jgi:hypothetical protein
VLSPFLSPARRPNGTIGGRTEGQQPLAVALAAKLESWENTDRPFRVRPAP